MTREHKLALIVGFALVLAVAILISDHFSGASRAKGGSILADGSAIQAQPALDGVGGREIAFDLPAARDIGGPGAEQPAEALASNERQDPSVLESLADSVRTALNDLGNGNTPPVALKTDVLDMGKPLAGEPAKPAEKDPAADVDPRDLKRHNVQEKETLWSIAEKYYGDGHLSKELAAFNKGRVGDGGAVYPGVTLLIPARNILIAGKVLPPDAKPGTTPAKATTTREYTVKSGDTLGEIAKKELGSAKRWREIVDLNKDVITDPDHVAAGTKIKLPKN